MELIELESQMLRAVAYDVEAQELFAVFQKGNTYRYSGVPQNIYDELLNADSKGRYMNANVVGKYPHKRVHRIR